MNVNDYDLRQEAINRMEKVSKKTLAEANLRLRGNLNHEEQYMFDEITKLSFKEGAWYRPEHNIVVISAMGTLCNVEGLNRKILMPTAITHDVGNSYMTVNKGKGADWESKDKRMGHRRIGADKVGEMLHTLYEADRISYTPEQISQIQGLIITHDDPYLGVDLTTDLEMQHRDADRLFVPSVLSWYKDYLNYKDDQKDTRKQNLTPAEFLSQRLAFFYDTAIQNPFQLTHPLETNLAQYNEGGAVEVMNTATAQQMLNHIMGLRINEFEGGVWDTSLDEFVEFFDKTLEFERDYFIGMFEATSS
ncbi:hypothetical protein ISS09_04860 [Candidatus Woesearchaeota archaeon]|nr:hypothetical protein [Candidatus Woesearchaeota archaeon]